ncbi:MAG: ComEC/Rec2 family competence protein [Acidobacteriota bacterium]|nr:ComEC/Rec2 family competence protein [Acidobacteriota bacterium]
MSSNDFPRKPNQLIRLPLFLASLWLAAGIAVERLLSSTPPLLWGLGFAGLWTLWAVQRRRTTFQPMTGLRLAAACLVVGGAWAASIERQAGAADDRIRVRLRGIEPETPLRLTGWLTDWPEPAVGRITLDLDVVTLALPASALAQPVRGRVRLFLPLTQPEHVLEWERLALTPGDLLTVTATLSRQGRYANPGDYDVGAYLDWRGYDAQGYVIAVARVQAASSLTLWRWLRKLRLWAIHYLQRDFDARTSGLLAGVVFGSDRFLDATWAEQFRRSGTFHLLVISGSHFALLAGGAAWLLTLATHNRWTTATVVLTAVWSYALLVGLEPPVWRAAIAVSVWQATRLFYRESHWLNVLGACACVLLIAQPSNLFAPSFQLTFGAALALVGVAAPLYARLRAIGAWRPTRATPYPPAAPLFVRRFAETLFWRERRFRQQMRREPVRYRLDKSPWAGRLERIGYGDWNLQTLLRWTFGALLAGVCVQVVLSPLNIAYFNRLTPGGGVTTLVAELVMTGVLLSTLGYFLVLGLLPPAAVLFKWLTTSGVWGLAAVADLGGWCGNWRIAHWEGWGLVVYGGFAVGCWLLGTALHAWRPLDPPTPRPLRYATPALGFMLCSLFGWLVVAPPRAWRTPSDDRLRVTFLDVGQGDCILVECPTGETLLVDAGGRPADIRSAPDDFREDIGDIGERVIARCLWARGIDRLNAVVATHPDADHVGGFTTLAGNIPIGQVWHGPACADDAVFQRLVQALGRYGVPRRFVHAGLQTHVGNVKLTFLWPPADTAPTGTNDDSVVVRIDYGRRSFLLTGDIEGKSEQALIAASAPLACDVVKAPHHGSRSSSSAEFVKATQAAHVVFSAPRQSPFGHPHPDIVNRYADLLPRAGQWHTGRDGAVTFETDGETLRVYGYASQRASW